ncbi:unnamed protein product, partial [Scytosiphon promiscuus]
AGLSAERSWSSSRSPSPSPPAADEDGVVHADLAFLARLAAVNGALGLCVAARAEAGPASTADAPTGGSSSGSGSCSNSGSRCGGERGDKLVACKKNGGAGKKGFAQALAELASFLETRAARQGFGGR